jgi:dipeptidyl aminopeptidase/acylaminoacyl peptidase
MFHYWNDGTPEAHVFSFQLTWLFSEAYQGAADTNELLRACKNIRSGNLDDWFRAFFDLGEQLQKIADTALEAGHEATASEHYFRAFTYLRVSERGLLGQEERKRAIYERAMACWRKGMSLSVHPHERVVVPFEGKELEGWFFAPRHRIRSTPPPCVLFLSGADALPEENFFRGIQYVTARGAACFVFNGPGQGSSLRVLGLPTRHDFEKPVTAAMDVLVQRTDIDPERIGLLGVSMAGYYGPRAVSFEHRIKACVVWGALYDVLQDLYVSYPPIQHQLRWIGGCATDEEARAHYAAFTLEGCLSEIRCPVLITHGIGDRMVPLASAQRTFDELKVADKTLRLYDYNEGGAEHCSMDNWSQVIPYQVDWLLDRLERK